MNWSFFQTNTLTLWRDSFCFFCKHLSFLPLLQPSLTILSLSQWQRLHALTQNWGVSDGNHKVLQPFIYWQQLGDLISPSSHFQPSGAVYLKYDCGESCFSFAVECAKALWLALISLFHIVCYFITRFLLSLKKRKGYLNVSYFVSQFLWPFLLLSAVSFLSRLANVQTYYLSSLPLLIGKRNSDCIWTFRKT